MRVHFLSLQFSSLAATHLKTIEPIAPPPKMTPLSAVRTSSPKEHPQEVDVPEEEKKEAEAKSNVFICEVCNTPYNYKSNLKRHMRLHTGERPFTCCICRKGFTNSSNMKQHM